jgi:hypothetical protein
VVSRIRDAGYGLAAHGHLAAGRVAGDTRRRIAMAWQAPASTTKSGGTIAKCSGNVSGRVKFQFTNHAQRALAEREIPIEWVERTLKAPELTLPDPNDATVERCFRRIPEFGGRVLRVAVNRTVEPKRVVSVFFDRRMEGKL